jgi:ABC-type amino acid transport substrate-binding protein
MWRTGLVGEWLRRLAWLAVAGALAWMAPAWAVPPKSITVVMDDDYPPYVFRDASGRVQGLLVDQWALWGQRTGVEVNLQPMDWAKAQKVLLAGEADVIDTMFETEARQKL